MLEQRTARTVKNRDIPLIQEIPYLKQEILSLEKRKQWEQERARNMTQHISGMPGGSGGTKRIIDDAVANMDEMKENHGLLIKQYQKRLRKAERILSEIGSITMRTFVTMMYLDQVRDSTVQEVLHMSRWTFENARSAVENAECMADVKWNDKYVCG